MKKEPVSCGVGQKSTILLLLVLFCLFNAAMLFRAAVNTLYFLEDAGKDYTEITATVTELQPEQDPSDNRQLITPVFSFDYKGEMMTRKAPALQYVPRESGTAPYRVGDVVSLWIHDFQGDIIVPPKLSRRDIGISQLVVSALSLVLALVLWKIRNALAGRKQKSSPQDQITS
ncbi:MAG: hypothetical protein L3J49_05945 [Desulfobulbaceae bacterium]|nr:hypothetical protein [Desulfobulbaceae bacterium]